MIMYRCINTNMMPVKLSDVQLIYSQHSAYRVSYPKHRSRPIRPNVGRDDL